MEPRIRYVKSGDGTRIAVATAGEGRPLVFMPTGWLTSVEVYWQIPETRQNLERLAERRRVVMYDTRGVGLSERDVGDFSLSTRLGDLTAAVDSLDAPSVDLLAQAWAGTVAISYAVKNPDKVGRLILANAVARGQDVSRPTRTRALRHLLEVDWELYCQAWALVYFGWTEMGRMVAEGFGSKTTAEIFLAAARAAREDDVHDLLQDVRCPTLIMQGRTEQIVSLDAFREIAAAIPNARFVPFDQEHPLAVATEEAVRTVEAFLDEEEAPARQAAEAEPSGTAIILFADVVDSTPLTESMGDKAFRDRARDLDTGLRSIIREAGGTPVEGKLLGDGVLAVFTSARQAIEAALACSAAGGRGGLPLHVGLHAGDVIREEGNVFGGAVNVAARIAAASAPGEVLVSDTVRSLARTSAGVTFQDRGEQSLKGVGEPVRVWAVREGGA